MANEGYATRQLQVVRDIRVFQPFEGANHTVMQRLLTGRDKDGNKVDFTRLPITLKQLVEGRLGRLDGATEADKKYLTDNYINTAVAVLPEPKGDSVKFSPEHSLIYGLTPETILNPFNLNFEQEVFDSAEGFILTAEKANKLRNNAYSLPNVRRAFWEAGLDGNVQLTKDYITDVEKSTGYKFDESAMGLWLPRSKGMRLLAVGSFGGNGRSGALGSLVDYDGRLVGYVAEPQVVAKKMGVSLEKLL